MLCRSIIPPFFVCISGPKGDTLRLQTNEVGIQFIQGPPGPPGPSGPAGFTGATGFTGKSLVVLV